MTKNELIYDDINKYEQLLKVSNPKKVIENSIKYFSSVIYTMLNFWLIRGHLKVTRLL